MHNLFSDAFVRFEDIIEDGFDEILDTFEEATHDVRVKIATTLLHRVIGGCLSAIQSCPVEPDDLKLLVPPGMLIVWEKIDLRISDLIVWNENPPENVDQMLDFLFDLLPSKIEITEAISVAVPGVAIDALKIGPGLVLGSKKVKGFIRYYLLDHLSLQAS